MKAKVQPKRKHRARRDWKQKLRKLNPQEIIDHLNDAFYDSVFAFSFSKIKKGR